MSVRHSNQISGPAAVSDELVYDNDATRVSRRTLPDGSKLIIKHAKSMQAIQRLAQELGVLKRLADVAGVAKLAAVDFEPNTIIFADTGGVALTHFLRGGAFSVLQWVELASALARTLTGVHRAGVIHKDLCPDKILIDVTNRQPMLIGFDVAALLTERNAADVLAGNLLYTSPEQTGRSGRTPDQRSDLYSLGVTLYEVATRCRPFTSEDVLELIHDHLVRIPPAPHTLNAVVPQVISDAIMRLLEKEPDKRYQSAVGLLHDLTRIAAGLAAGNLATFGLGQFDFGARLQPPKRLVGRAREVAGFEDALARVGDGRLPCLLVSGAAGVGKSALLAELKPLAAASKALCVFARFDEYKQGPSGAMQALGRQLLAESESQLVQYCTRIRAALGNNLGVGPTLLPEFQLLLGQHAAVEISDAPEAEIRAAQASLSILRAVASATRPLVLVLDDLQWAPNVSLRLADAILTSRDPIPGLLMVYAYRNCHVDASQLLRRYFERWQVMGLMPPQIGLENLSQVAASEFVGAMLQLPAAQADKLAAVLAARTDNNPYNTVEVINALRHDGVLDVADGAWYWDAAAVRRHVGNTSAADLLERRIAKLPATARDLLQVLACLASDVSLQVLEWASAMTASEIRERLAPLLDDGLVVLVTEGDISTARFPSNRVQQAVFAGLEVGSRQQLHLRLARQLALRAKDVPQLDALTAEQYLPAADGIVDEVERRLAVEYFTRAAGRLRLLSAAVAHKYFAAAVLLLEAVERPEDADQMFALLVELHRSLFALGRLDEVDAAYAALVARASSPVKLATASRIQMYSLNNRRRQPDSLAVGLGLLERLGLVKPADVRAEIAAGFKRLAEFNAGEDKLKDFERPEAQDEKVIAWSITVAPTVTPAYYCDAGAFAWLVVQSHRLWVEYGPSRSLLSGMCAAGSLLIGSTQDYSGAYAFLKHVLAVGDARNYQPPVSHARCMFAIGTCHWFEPLESGLAEFQRARNDLLSLGDESFFLSTFVSVDLLFDLAPTLDVPLAEVELGLSYAARSANADFQQRNLPRRQLILTLRGATSAPGSFSDAQFDEAKYLATIDPTSLAAWIFHALSAISAMIFGDMDKLVRHCALAMPLNARAPGYYFHAVLRSFLAVTLSEQARKLSPQDRAPLLAELDANCLRWMRARAADAPVNFLHLLKWIEAERAWAADSVWAAGAAFDAAVTEAELHQRPWHRAVITERAARFHLQHGLEHSGRVLMSRALEAYTLWGAAGKVKELQRQHAFLRSSSKVRTELAGSDMLRGAVVDADMVDMVAVLRASQALSSQTSLPSLTATVGKVLGAITGATRVQLVVRSEDDSTWVMAQSLADGVAPILVEQASAAGELPYSVFKYAERTGQVLLIEDLVQDERFATDPYAARFAQCSLMLVPVLKQGRSSGMLVLENEQRRGAFSADRLDAVAMIAGQLSVSLDNAVLYASLEQRVADRTAQLRQRTADIQAMLQNMPQGVLTVMRGNRVHPEYSAHLATILETQQIAGQDVMQLLFANTSLGADVLSQIEAAMAACIGEDAMNYDFNAHVLVTEFELTLSSGAVKSLALSWSAICDDASVVDRLMLCVRDVTELKRLESEASARKRELQLIGEVLAVSQEKFHEFIDGSCNLLHESCRLIESTSEKPADVIDVLFRNMHTLKGNARTYGLLGLADRVHVVEQSYADLRSQMQVPWDADRLFQELADVRGLIEQYAHVNDVVLGRKGPGRHASADRYLMVERDLIEDALQRLSAAHGTDAAVLLQTMHDVGARLRAIGTQAFGEILAGTLDSLPSLAAELGKEPPRVTIEDRGIRILMQAGSLLRNLFTHLLRNALDHGIETTAERRAQDKPVRGHIRLELALTPSQLCVVLRDDGRGLAIARIRARAAEQGLENSSELSANAAAQLIFESGFSTAERVTEISGRGVGMDAARGFLAREGGSIDVRFLDEDEHAAYRVFETVITLPARFAVALGT